MAHIHTGYDRGPTSVPRPAARPPGGPPDDGAGPPDAVRVPARGPAMADLRHPTEPSRFALALVASSVPVAVALFVLVSLGQETRVIAMIGGVIVGLLLVWVGIQVWRIRLLGDAVLVTAETMPEVQEVLDVVRARLHYERRIDLFVVDKVSRVLSPGAAPITLTTFFGVHVLVAEGDALGDLSDERERRQLLFALATYVGALKARYAQWASPLFTAFRMTKVAATVWPFVYPWYRATVYSGDRIAYTCCADLDVSLQAVYRSLVGPGAARHVRAEGFTGQALLARRRPLLRFAQLLRPTPHATNRYLELLAFVRQSSPDAFGVHRPALRAVGAEVDPVLARLAGKRAHPNVLAAGVVLALAVLAGGLAVGVGVRDSSVARAIAEGAGGSNDDDAGAGDGTGPVTPTTEPSAPPDPVALGLLALLPADLRSNCAIGASDASAQVLASVRCAPAGNHPQQLVLNAYPNAQAMTTAVDGLAGSLPSGDCSSGNSRGRWTYDGVTQGPLACYESEAGYSTILWGSDAKAVLVLAGHSTWSQRVLYEWWAAGAIALQ